MTKNTQWKRTKPFLWLGTASFLLVLILSSCGNNQVNEKENHAPISDINSAPTAEPDPIKVLASPIKLQPNKTIVYLTDYIWNPSIIESISANENLDVKHVGDSLELTPNESLPKLSTLDLQVAGHTYSIPVFKSQKLKFKLRYKAKEGEKHNTVKVKGEFNNWNMEAGIMQLQGDEYIFESYAEPGFYQYVFVIDTLEITDPRNDSTVSNGMGGFNSVLPVISIDKLQTPVLSTQNFTDNEITLGLENGAEQILTFWGNQRIEANKAKNSITIQIPDAASQLNRSYIRCYAANGNRLSNDVLIPLQKGKVITDANELTRHDHHTGILYNAFVDRFYDGDAENNSKTEGNIHPKANYHGGDIAGVHQKIEEGYFQDLGVNTIWI
ncbi:MAG: hypothetical protein KDC92_14215, partial [Bacteroidetes bacterium]|nr:hypothetical protein [Bacteroidota bacterium]